MPSGIYFKDYIFAVGILRSLHASFIFLVDLEQSLFAMLLKWFRLRCIKKTETTRFHTTTFVFCSVHILYIIVSGFRNSTIDSLHYSIRIYCTGHWHETLMATSLSFIIK